MEQMQYNLMFRWFVGLGVDDRGLGPDGVHQEPRPASDDEHARKFLAAILAHREVAPLLSDEHFSVDGTLVKAWASMKSFQPKPEPAPPGDGDGPDDPPPPSPAADVESPAQTEPETAPMTRAKPKERNAEVDFRGQKRSNATHASVTDPEARLYKKSPGAGASLASSAIR